MHYHAEVWIPTDEDVEAQIRVIMDPHCEHTHDDGFWDFWQIGGCWKGTHVPGYDPNSDPDHKEVCRLCGGSGTRSDGAKFGAAWLEHFQGCNGCKGTGISTTWPTKWTSHPKDIIPVSEVTESLTCATLMLPNQALHQQVWNGESFIDTDFKGNVLVALHAAGIEDGFLVTVDYHS